MPLLALWKSSPETVTQFTIQQIVAFAGDGKLLDGSECSMELRSYIKEVPTSDLSKYIDQCLEEGFPKSGQVLQDLVNELGRRLEYSVENGLYSGRQNMPGNDGLWTAPEGNSVVVEVKTTDAYRLSLDRIAGYRRSLRQLDRVTDDASILIVVGREETGELEAQVRGSRHAWDVRLISVEALLKLVILRENAEDETGRKIRGLLIPVEYTRVDALVDVMFSTAADVGTEIEEEIVESKLQSSLSIPSSLDVTETTGNFEFTDAKELQAKRDSIISTLSGRFGKPLVKRSRATYWTPDRPVRVACTLSKRYSNSRAPYWYAYHPSWNDFLKGSGDGLFVLGAMDLERAFAIPVTEMQPILGYLNTTETKKGEYWHIHLLEVDGQIRMVVPKGESVSLEAFAFPI